MQERLFDYWYNLEFFQPSWPVKKNEDINLQENALPWPQKTMNPNTNVFYDIYFGCSKVFDLIEWALKKLTLLAEDSPIERDQSPTCLCALKVDENGMYVHDSFAVSSLVWALGRMVQENPQANHLRVKLDLDKLDELQKRVDAALYERRMPFSLGELQAVFIQICDETGVEPSLFSPSLWARVKTQHRKKDGTFSSLEPATELMSSYYVREIARVKKSPGKRINRYVEALYAKPPKRIMIDTDIMSMQRLLEAGCFPLGAWPSAHSPSLMQQLAINLAISNQDILSVNGPPGTGKTTLLKEIVASNIVQRAALMAAYANPDDAFRKDTFENPPDQFSRTFYRPDEALTVFGMLVASNNNAAVENISVELPKAVEEDRSGHFKDNEDTAQTYFSDIASALLQKPAWGLISARLGKKRNLGELKDRLWWAGDGVTLKQYYDQALPDWEVAKKNFDAALNAVTKKRNKIAKVQEMLKQYKQASDLERIALTELERLQTEAEDQHALYDEQKTALQRLEETYSLQRQNIVLLKSSLPLFKRLMSGMYKKDPVVQEWKQAESLCAETLIALTRQQTALQAQAGVLETVHQLLQQQEAYWEKTKEQRCWLEAALEPERKRFGANYADEHYWQNISSNEASQSACPWTNKAYDKSREELFYRALMLQKAFVLNSKCVKQNLNRLFKMWDDRFALQDRQISYGSLLNTLFFVVPVISTTFASVQSFLQGVQPGELGMLVVDEAGQATPQSALGALWRTRKAIIVGDPLQVQPIITTPLELCKRFADDSDLPPNYRTPELSVQMLADAQNPYGGLRQMGEEQLWLGCPLVVHRRCIEPMFSISNEVAYNGRMFCKTKAPAKDEPFLLERSAWFDIPGKEKGHKDHTVPEQIDFVADMMKKAVAHYGGLPDLYIITPFTSVKRSLEKKLRELLPNLLPEEDANDVSRWLNESCGTIHTFQGKEANEVLLVLGCDAQQGMRAACWVGQTPNIINVAVSRAKYRIGVIGSYDLWRGIPHVQTVCKKLHDAVNDNVAASL